MAKLHVKSRFGVIPNALLHSDQFSWKAKGLYGYIQSKPEDWEFAIERMESSDGKDSTRSGIQELEDSGYLIREKVRKDDGTFEVIYTLFEDPHRGGKSAMDTTLTVAGNPPSENPPSIKERVTKKEEYTPLPPQAGESLEENFKEFYKAYPLKKAPGYARKAYIAARKKTSHEKIMEGLSRYNSEMTKLHKQQKEERKPLRNFAYPASWLNGERWDEEPEIESSTVLKTRADQQEREKKRLAELEKERAEEIERIHRRNLAEAIEAKLTEEQKQGIRDYVLSLFPNCNTIRPLLFRSQCLSEAVKRYGGIV